MVNAGIEPNVHTYGALIDGCAKAGQVAKAFGAYGIMRSKVWLFDRFILFYCVLSLPLNIFFKKGNLLLISSASHSSINSLRWWNVICSRMWSLIELFSTHLSLPVVSLEQWIVPLMCWQKWMQKCTL